MSLQELFPQAQITKHGDHEEIHDLSDYVWGYSGPDEKLTLDGEFTAVQLRALADWMDEKR